MKRWETQFFIYPDQVDLNRWIQEAESEGWLVVRWEVVENRIAVELRREIDDGAEAND